MSSKLVTLFPPATPSTADWQDALNRESVSELWAFKDAYKLSDSELGKCFGYSDDSIGRYLSGKREVPGPIVRALINWRMAKEAA